MNSRLAKVHWQAGDRLLPVPAVSVAGESVQWVDPAEIPSDGDIAKFGRALASGVHGDRDELMANTAAYSGLRWGELVALTVAQVLAVGWRDADGKGAWTWHSLWHVFWTTALFTWKLDAIEIGSGCDRAVLGGLRLRAPVGCPVPRS